MSHKYSTDKAHCSSLLLLCKAVKSSFHANSFLPNMVNVPKIHLTFYKVVWQASTLQSNSTRRARILCTGKLALWQQSGYGGQTKPIFRKKTKTTKIVLRLKCIVPNSYLREYWLLRNASILNWEEIKRERAKWASSKLHILFYYVTIKAWGYVKKTKSFYVISMLIIIC